MVSVKNHPKRTTHPRSENADNCRERAHLLEVHLNMSSTGIGAIHCTVLTGMPAVNCFLTDSICLFAHCLHKVCFWGSRKSWEKVIWSYDTICGLGGFNNEHFIFPMAPRIVEQRLFSLQKALQKWHLLVFKYIVKQIPLYGLVDDKLPYDGSLWSLYNWIRTSWIVTGEMFLFFKISASKRWPLLQTCHMWSSLPRSFGIGQIAFKASSFLLDKLVWISPRIT